MTNDQGPMTNDESPMTNHNFKARVAALIK